MNQFNIQKNTLADTDHQQRDGSKPSQRNSEQLQGQGHLRLIGHNELAGKAANTNNGSTSNKFYTFNNIFNT